MTKATIKKTKTSPVAGRSSKKGRASNQKNGKNTIVKDKKTGKDVLASNDAREARILLDIVSQSDNISAVLSDVLVRLDGTVSSVIVSRIKAAQEAANNIRHESRKQMPKVSAVPYIIRAYDKAKVEEDVIRSSLGLKERQPVAMLRAFNHLCQRSLGFGGNKSSREEVARADSDKENRRSSRLKDSATDNKNAFNGVEFTGLPPPGKEWWTKEDIVAAVGPFTGRIRKQRILAVLKKKKTDYKSDSGIYLLLKNCASGGSPRSRGRPSHVKAKNVVDITTAKARETAGRAVKLSAIKDAVEEGKREGAVAAGMSPDSITRISDQSAKIASIAAAMMDGFELSLTQKRLQIKTKTRYIAENSFRSMYAYATTVLATHFIVGTVPREGYPHYDPSKLSEDARNTMKWVAEAHGVESVYPANPNLVLSTDDTTVFAFCGTSEDGSDWSWKFLSPSEDGGHLSDYEVGADAENSGGLRVRLTFTFTATGLMAPPYVAVSGLTEDELPVEDCPDGILVKEIPGLCKGGSNNVFAEGSRWLVLLRADKKADKESQEEAAMGIANKKFVQYHHDVLLPFISKIREKLGWKEGQDIPESLTAVSWSDGDIPQLQTMMYENGVLLDAILRIVRCKHSSAATAVEQPADCSPVFRLLDQLQKEATAEGDTACGLQQTIDGIFGAFKDEHGVNLAPRKRKALVDFLCCLPANLESAATKEHIKLGFKKAGMLDKLKSGYVPVFKALMNTCRRERSLQLEELFLSKLQPLLKVQLEHGQISYDDMAAHGIPADVDPDGKEVTRARLAGPDGEHLQPAKQINHSWQKKERDAKRRKQAQEAVAAALVKYNVIKEILRRNSTIETTLKSKTSSGLLSDVPLSEFMKLSIPQLKDFIHARKFTGSTFHQSQLTVPGKPLKKTLFKGQTAEQVESLCSEENPCLVWLAWSLLSVDSLLKLPAEPSLESFIVVPNPTFITTYAGTAPRRTPADYLRNEAWINSMKLHVKGVNMVDVDEDLVTFSGKLLSHLDSRFDLYVADRVDKSKQKHPVLKFVSRNLPAMSTLLAICAHITDDLESENVDSCLLRLPVDGVYQIIAGDLKGVEGCYLYYDRTKAKWIRSGKTSGASNASFEVRGGKNTKNAKKIDEMRVLDFIGSIQRKACQIYCRYGKEIQSALNHSKYDNKIIHAWTPHG